MKIYRIFLYFLIVAGISSSCSDYLDKIEDADITDEDIFTNFADFQGFVEVMYGDIINLTIAPNNGPTWNYGDDFFHKIWGTDLNGGNYWAVLNGRSAFHSNSNDQRGYAYSGSRDNINYWQNGWKGIRQANVALSKLDKLQNATPEEINILKGQIYFFRGYLHWEIMRCWGNIPYSDNILTPTSDLNIPQLENFQATAEKVIADLEKAAEYLPVDWDQTVVGQRTANQNLGRLTKGAALAMLSEVFLFSGSPLVNGVSTGSYTYNTDYMKRSAEAAWKVIQLANQDVYQLEPWENLPQLFRTVNRTFPIKSKENIFSAMHRTNARWYAQTFQWASIGGEAVYSSPTHNYAELFGMKNGLPLDDPESGYDPKDPFSNREPRYYFNFFLDGERIVKKENVFLQLYIGGAQRNANNSQTGYGWKKFWEVTVNNIDNGWGGGNFHTFCPRMRLGEIYLIYAEAVNEAYGPNGTHPGANLTAVDAVNIIRRRSQTPDIHQKFTTNKETFRERVWNERAVELAFEAKRWYDIRRWYVAHLDKYKELYALEFDKGHTYFRETLLYTRVFDQKHYWFPFPTDQVNLYEGWKQNPGW